MQVRVFWVDGEPLFDAAGVCEAVGMRNVEKALRKLDDDEKGAVVIEGPGGREEIPVVRESGMLRLTLLGKNEHARAFQRWVLREVLPSALHDESQYGEEKLRAQKTALLVDLLTTFQERLSDEAVERLVTAVADVLRDEKG
ncbi:phage repressor protein [Alicyclobacillus acidocaldarius]|uniref:Prophage antirepressor n=2 Tax=Alicyclobacillus TaxID=29330 RepID=F8ILC1_ALIAT|nr:phage repressor protein [Alicyclobacillus acidocaldarius]AEJ43687.1 prophage antirepressor [Alicyclobacillus acidocaldarius subsp. acidocaldarius Tc-4-1]